MRISVHSTNKPLFPQNYTAWTTPTQLIKKHHSLLYRLLPTATSTLLRITRGSAQHKMDVGHDSNRTTGGRYKITRHRYAIHSDRHQYVVTTSFHCPTDFWLPTKLGRNSFSSDGFNFTTTVDCKVSYNQKPQDCRSEETPLKFLLSVYSRWRLTCECNLLVHKLHGLFHNNKCGFSSRVSRKWKVGKKTGYFRFFLHKSYRFNT